MSRRHAIVLLVAAALALPLAAPAVAVAPGAGASRAQGFALSVLHAPDVVPGGPGVLALRTTHGDLEDPGHGLRLSSEGASCSRLSPYQSSCELTFDNEPGSIRTVLIRQTAHAGTVRAEVKLLNQTLVTELVCTVPTVNPSTLLQGCSGEGGFRSEEPKLLLDVTASGAGLFVVEVY